MFVKYAKFKTYKKSYSNFRLCYAYRLFLIVFLINAIAIWAYFQIFGPFVVWYANYDHVGATWPRLFQLLYSKSSMGGSYWLIKCIKPNITPCRHCWFLRIYIRRQILKISIKNHKNLVSRHFIQCDCLHFEDNWYYCFY